MSNAFTNFLSGAVNGVFGNSADLRDYQHASRLYVSNTYARAPKIGFLYFVSFNINPAAALDRAWLTKGGKEVGLLVKKIDLPKFDVTTETVNQYNRKTIVQTSLKYQPVSIDFHDDNSDITNGLWKNYYNYYYADGTVDNKNAFVDTKYQDVSYQYGLKNNDTAAGKSVPLFDSVDIYVLHQGKFTQITLVNPIITSWAHDSLSQDDGSRPLSNRMSLIYETVRYNQGTITKGSAAGAFSAVYYDNTPSPLSVSGNGTKTILGAGGVLAGADAVLGSLASGNFLAAAIQANTAVKNLKQITKASLVQEGYSIVNGALGNIAATGNQPAGQGTSTQPGLGNVGINLYSNKNSSVNGTTKTTPSNLTGS